MWKACPEIQPSCGLRKHWRSLSHQRVLPPKQRSRSCPERCNMRRLENCDEQLVEPESGWDGVSAFQGRCVTLPPFETGVDEKWEQGGVCLKGKEFPEHSLYGSLNRLRTQKDRSCLCAEKLLLQVHQRCQKFKNSLQRKGQRLLWTYSRWRQGQVPLLCLKVVKFIY